ncbi:glycosyltransferase family 2 protein [Afipia broomeae]|uniref:Glycosyltransferase 2-like domain-containing protein n=2 Tax=Pseudomonadota TaxID=1224 RepID=K8PIW0_9BRAD|nr:glycosyltransferase family 2 protein [Afipia broomeae]EKS38283.1 hypothetical protein HMPREF9695_02123 [Afipia broomeae ATCC 49717]
MKVRDLVRDTEWIPGSDYVDGHKPAISVLLPTFRRGASGLFRKAVKSVLGQTLHDLELIIVDDASTDGTADQIAEFMREDGRVSCLRHPNNIGLPAVSEFEAFMKARADYIAFAFDDDTFYPDAFAQLLQHSLQNPDRVYFGCVTMFARHDYSSNVESIRLGCPLADHNLQGRNLISNSAVLLPRSVIDAVGFYDPHIIMARLCDWDLWRRVSERYLLQYVDVSVGEVTGPATEDSLGKTYPLVMSATEEWMRAGARRLTSQDYFDVDVFSSRPEISTRTAGVIDDLVMAHVANRPWLRKHFEESNDSKTIVVLTSSYDASTSLYFDNLPSSVRGRIRIVLSERHLELTELASASCVIVVRHFDIHEEWIDAAKRMRVPLYYFLDDNFVELASVESYQSSEDFSLNGLRTKLERFAGVLLSSKELLEYFEANLIHPNLSFFPVSYARSPKSARFTISNSFDLTVASIGGKHRQRGLQECVLPALQRLASDACRIHFVIGGCDPEDSELLSKIAASENLKLTLIPFNVEWNRAILQLAEHRPDVLIHAPSKTINNKYKTLNVALSAYILDCVLIVPNDPPYDLVEFDGAAVRVEPANEPGAWLQAVRNLLSKRETWDGYKKANATFCRTQFSGEQNLVVLNEILQSSPAISPALVETRLKELYLSKSVSAGNNLFDSEPLRASLLQLSQFRAQTRRNQRYRPHRPREDIWPRISPAFEDIRQHVLKNKIRSSSSYLELSDSLHDVAYAEYPIHIEKGQLKSMTCALSSEGIHSGLVGVELVAPNDTIAVQSSRDLAPLNLHLPVTFDLKNTVVQEGIWKFRFFARSEWPLYILEFAEYSRFGWSRRVIAPFVKIEYAGQAETGARSTM